MNRKYICDGEKYEIGGPNGDTIGLPVFFKDMPSTVEVGGNKLLRKDAFHVSLVCIGKIMDKHNIQTPDFVNKLIVDFCAFVRQNPIELICYRDEFRLVEENEKCSVVVMCDISNLDKFFHFLNQKYSLNFEYPPTHVTLYTLQQNIGIFLTDAIDMKKLTQLIPNPIGKML